MYMRNVLFCLLNCLENKKEKKGVSGSVGQRGTNCWIARD